MSDLMMNINPEELKEMADYMAEQYDKEFNKWVEHMEEEAKAVEAERERGWAII